MTARARKDVATDARAALPHSDVHTRETAKLEPFDLADVLLRKDVFKNERKESGTHVITLRGRTADQAALPQAAPPPFSALAPTLGPSLRPPARTSPVFLIGIGVVLVGLTLGVALALALLD